MIGFWVFEFILCLGDDGWDIDFRKGVEEASRLKDLEFLAGSPAGVQEVNLLRQQYEARQEVGKVGGGALDKGAIERYLKKTGRSGVEVGILAGAELGYDREKMEGLWDLREFIKPDGSIDIYRTEDGHIRALKAYFGSDYPEVS